MRQNLMVPPLLVQWSNHIKSMYGIETATNGHQTHDDCGSANSHQISPYIHSILNCPFKITYQLSYM